MQEELDAMGVDVAIHGVNEIGHGGLDDMSELGDLPVLQDTLAESVWDRWGVSFRDVFILNDANMLVATYNLTSHSLSTTENYEELKAMFIAAAED